MRIIRSDRSGRSISVDSPDSGELGSCPSGVIDLMLAEFLKVMKGGGS